MKGLLNVFLEVCFDEPIRNNLFIGNTLVANKILCEKDITVDKAMSSVLQGLSLIAVEETTGEVVGIAINNIYPLKLINKHIDTLYWYEYTLYSLHLCTLAVLPQFRGRKIGYNLTRLTVEEPKRLKNEGREMKWNPTYVTADFVTRGSKRIAKKLKFSPPDEDVGCSYRYVD